MSLKVFGRNRKYNLGKEKSRGVPIRFWSSNETCTHNHTHLQMFDILDVSCAWSKKKKTKLKRNDLELARRNISTVNVVHWKFVMCMIGPLYELSFIYIYC
jgi:replication initiation and membrane attachment protein DnaB